MKNIVFFFICLIVVSCDPHSAFKECSYHYPINVIGLNDTIKTTDTIWIENDLDAKLCLNEGIYVNGKGIERASFYRLTGDTFISIRPMLIVNDSISISDSIFYDYDIPYLYINGRYKSKYGIIFSKSGIYAMKDFGCLLANGKDGSISIQGYFNVSTNNMNLFAASVKMPAWEIGQPYRYFVYFLQVIE